MLRALASFAFCVLGSAAFADAPPPDRLVLALRAEATAPPGRLDAAERALLLALQAWLAQEDEVPPFDELPRLRRVGEGGFGRILASLVEGEAPAGLGDGVEALYADPTATVLLSAGWRHDRVRDQSVLLHELVHHAQHLSGQRFSCPEERERLAYEVQGRFLAARGTSLEAEFGIDRMTLLVRTTCLW